MDRGLDQAAGHHGARGGTCIRIVAGAGHLAGQQGRGALAVRGLLAGQRPTDRLDSDRQPVPRLVARCHAGRTRSPGRHEEHRVAGAGIAVYGQLVPGPGHDRAQHPRQVRGSDVGVGEHVRQHRGHPGMDHAHALGDPRYGHPLGRPIDPGQVRPCRPSTWRASRSSGAPRRRPRTPRPTRTAHRRPGLGAPPRCVPWGSADRSCPWRPTGCGRLARRAPRPAPPRDAAGRPCPDPRSPRSRSRSPRGVLRSCRTCRRRPGPPWPGAPGSAAPARLRTDWV